jgi:predicted MFS family arabinose efflux permease
VEHPERRPGPLIAAATGVIAVAYGLVRFSYGLFLPTFSAEFNLSAVVAGGIAAGSFAAYCVAAVTAQWLIGLGYPRRTLMVACGLATLGALITAAAWSPPSLAVGILVAGSASGAASPALVVAVAATVRGPASDRAQGIVNSGTGFGVVFAGLLAAALTSHWRLLWVGFAVTAVSVTWWADRCTAWPSHDARAQRAPWRPWAGLAPLRRFLLAALVAGAGSSAVLTFWRDLLTTRGLPETTTALLFVVLGGGSIVGALSGVLVQRLGLGLAWAATAVTVSISTAALVALPAVLPVAAAALAAFGASYVALCGVLIISATRFTPDRAAESAASLFIALTVGQALGAPVLGAVADATSVFASFLIAAALILISSVVPIRQGTHGGLRGGPDPRL